MNNKTLYIAVGVILLILLSIGGFFVFGKNSSPEVVEEEMLTLESIDPKEIGLSLNATEDGQNVILVLEKLAGIKHFAYEITYEADSKDPEARAEGVKVTRGFSDEQDVTEETFESKEYFLGTCSSGTCIPDKGVGTIKAVVKITKTDDSVYQSETELEI